MKKLLFVSTRPIFPIIGGDQIRTHQSLKLLCQYFDVHIIALVPSIESDEVVLQCSQYGEYTSFVISRFSHYFLALRFLFNDLPIQVNYFYSHKVQTFINNIINCYDIVYCNNLRTAEYFRHFSKIDRVIDYVDAISMNYEKAKLKSVGLKRIIYNVDFQRCMRYEAVLLNEFKAALVISKVDRDYILSHSKSKKNIFVVGNMVHYDEKARVVERFKNRIVF